MKTRKFLIFFPILTFFVRMWMIYVLPIIGGYGPLYRFDNSRYHHFEIGIGFLVSALLVSNFKNLKKYTLLFSVIGSALVLDEYIFILRIIGFRVPYRYLSMADTTVLMVIIVVILLSYSLGKKKR